MSHFNFVCPYHTTAIAGALDITSVVSQNKPIHSFYKLASYFSLSPSISLHAPSLPLSLPIILGVLHPPSLCCFSSRKSPFASFSSTQITIHILSVPLSPSLFHSISPFHLITVASHSYYNIRFYYPLPPFSLILGITSLFPAPSDASPSWSLITHPSYSAPQSIAPPYLSLAVSSHGIIDDQRTDPQFQCDIRMSPPFVP